MPHRAVALVWCVLVSSPALASTLPASWWSNQTFVQNVVQPAPAVEMARLEGGFTSGALDGLVLLPQDSSWRLFFRLTTDGDVDLPEEYVRLFINGGFIREFNNTPPGKISAMEIPVTGDQFTYGFEFDSPSTTFTDHMIVLEGHVMHLPVPDEETAALDWWSNRTASQGVSQFDAPTERLRLSGGELTGWIEGYVTFPKPGFWDLDITLASDESQEHPAEFIKVFIDSELVAQANNTPTFTFSDFQHVVERSGFHYRIEFDSPSTKFGDHMIVMEGFAHFLQPLPVFPVPASLLAGLLGLALVSLLSRAAR